MARMHPDTLSEAFSGYHVDSERVVYGKLARELTNGCVLWKTTMSIYEYSGSPLIEKGQNENAP